MSLYAVCDCQLVKKLIYIRDCAITNLVMDPSRMYPHGVHFDSPFFSSRGKLISHVRTRTQVGGVKYYYIDFGESIKFGPSDSARITVHSKASITAPETASTRFWPYDAFKPDIFTLGTTYKERVVKVLILPSSPCLFSADMPPKPYTSFDALLPLLDEMTQADPDTRPSAAEALEYFTTIKATFSRTALHGRVHRRQEPPESTLKRVVLDILHYSEQFAWAAQNWKW